MKNSHLESANSWSLVCEICNGNGLEAVQFGCVQGRNICLTCIQKYDLKSTDSTLDEERSQVIDKIRKEIDEVINEEDVLRENLNSCDSEELSKMVEYLNIICEAKYKLSEMIAIDSVLEKEILKLRRAAHGDPKSLSQKVNRHKDISENIITDKHLLDKILKLGVCEGLNYYKSSRTSSPG